MMTTERIQKYAIDERDVRAAATRLVNRSHLTPVTALPGFPFMVKREDLQFGGSFKFRGAANTVTALRVHDIVTASSGNHAVALRFAAPEASIRAVMQSDAPLHKRAMVERAGVAVVLCDGSLEDRNALAASLAVEGATLIPSSDHSLVMAGAGTVALEIALQVPDVSTIYVPIGGGGLAAGSIAALMSMPGIRVIGVEPENADDAAQSRRCGSIVSWQGPHTVCDGARHAKLSPTAASIIIDRIDDIVTVSDEAVLQVRDRLGKLGIAAEPTGCLALAGALRAPSRNGVAVLSGGNTPDVVQASFRLAG